MTQRVRIPTAMASATTPILTMTAMAQTMQTMPSRWMVQKITDTDNDGTGNNADDG